MFFVSVHSKDVKVLCFDTVSQVFILKELGCLGFMLAILGETRFYQGVEYPNSDLRVK